MPRKKVMEMVINQKIKWTEDSTFNLLNRSFYLGVIGVMIYTLGFLISFSNLPTFVAKSIILIGGAIIAIGLMLLLFDFLWIIAIESIIMVNNVLEFTFKLPKLIEKTFKVLQNFISR